MHHQMVPHLSHAAFGCYDKLDSRLKVHAAFVSSQNGSKLSVSPVTPYAGLKAGTGD